MKKTIFTVVLVSLIGCGSDQAEVQQPENIPTGTWVSTYTSPSEASWVQTRTITITESKITLSALCTAEGKSASLIKESKYQNQEHNVVKLDSPFPQIYSLSIDSGRSYSCNFFMTERDSFFFNLKDYRNNGLSFVTCSDGKPTEPYNSCNGVIIEWTKVER